MGHSDYFLTSGAMTLLRIWASPIRSFKGTVATVSNQLCVAIYEVLLTSTQFRV